MARWFHSLFRTKMDGLKMGIKKMDDYGFHGDVHVISIGSIPKEADPTDEKVLEYGQVTGHAHRFTTDTATLFKTKDGRKYLRVVEPTDLKHEEHHTRTITPGDYEIRRTLETDHLSGVTRAVAD